VISITGNAFWDAGTERDEVLNRISKDLVEQAR
jgi:hypothetical protein